jgi:hypothetical protein
MGGMQQTHGNAATLRAVQRWPDVGALVKNGEQALGDFNRSMQEAALRNAVQGVSDYASDLGSRYLGGTPFGEMLGIPKPKSPMERTLEALPFGIGDEVMDTYEDTWLPAYELAKAKHEEEKPQPRAESTVNEFGGQENFFALEAGKERGKYGIEGDSRGLFWEGKLGSWQDGNAVRHGFAQNIGVAKTKVNLADWLSVDLGLVNDSQEATVTDGGSISLGTQQNLADIGATVGNADKASAHDTINRLGVSAGFGAAGRLHSDDADRDGYDELGFGFDWKYLSADVKTEDPAMLALKTAMHLNPLTWGAGYALPYVVPDDVNLTDVAVDSSRWALDKVGSAAGGRVQSATDYGSEWLNQVWNVSRMERQNQYWSDDLAAELEAADEARDRWDAWDSYTIP